MSALAQLAESLGLPSDPLRAPATASVLTAANDPRAKAPAAPEPISEPKRTAWGITRAGQPIGYMVGQPMTYSEALAVIHWRWPDAQLNGTKSE